jgi:NADH-quinone oxidoreductase subunit G
VARALRRKGKTAYLSFVMAECNSFGLGLMGPKGLDEVLSGPGQVGAEVAIILENDLFRRAEMDRVDDFLQGLRHVVVIDHLFHRTALKADTVLPAATFAEGEGTLVNNEGRAQRYFQVFPARGEVQASWQWLRDIIVAGRSAAGKGWESLDGLMASMARSIPPLARAAEAAPQAGFRIAGMKVAREHGRYSGRTAMDANRSVHEPEPPADADSPFTFSMEGYGGRPPSALIPRFWAPGWNSVQSVNKFQAEVGGPLYGGDPGTRLVEPSGGEADYFGEAPGPFVQRDYELFIVPSYHVFGSEELSVLTPGVASRAPGPYLALCGKDMARLRVREGEVVSLSVDGRACRLEVRLAAELPDRIAAVPLGLPQSPVWTLPAFGRVERELP